jgi:hypothetical protein
MAASPDWKVYLGSEYRAAFKYAEDAAALLALLGTGATLRHGHRTIVWREGEEEHPAAESYDAVCETAHRRVADACRSRPDERDP